MPETAYLLGHSELEHRRLTIQAAFFRPYTEHFLRTAGIQEGMHVIDVGSGLGDVALIAAGIVGPSGTVTAVERDPVAAGQAHARARLEGFADTVAVRIAAIEEFIADVPADALVGRYVLQYQPDPACALRHLLRSVKPGGIVAFHDMDFSNADPTTPPCAAWDEHYALLTELFIASGVAPDFGRRLTSTFLAAGLPTPTVEGVAPVGGRADSPLFAWLGSAVEAISPQLAAAGIDLPPRPTGQPLASYLADAVSGAGSQVLGPMQYGAWARRP